MLSKNQQIYKNKKQDEEGTDIRADIWKIYCTRSLSATWKILQYHRDPELGGGLTEGEIDLMLYVCEAIRAQQSGVESSTLSTSSSQSSSVAVPEVGSEQGQEAPSSSSASSSASPAPQAAPKEHSRRHRTAKAPPVPHPSTSEPTQRPSNPPAPLAHHRRGRPHVSQLDPTLFSSQEPGTDTQYRPSASSPSSVSSGQRYPASDRGGFVRPSFSSSSEDFFGAPSTSSDWSNVSAPEQPQVIYKEVYVEKPKKPGLLASVFGKAEKAVNRLKGEKNRDHRGSDRNDSPSSSSPAPFPSSDRPFSASPVGRPPAEQRR